MHEAVTLFPLDHNIRRGNANSAIWLHGLIPAGEGPWGHGALFFLDEAIKNDPYAKDLANARAIFQREKDGGAQ